MGMTPGITKKPNVTVWRGTAKPLLGCRDCGAKCRVEMFPDYCGEVDFRTPIWLCSKHKMLGGTCSSETAYLTQEAWNDRDG